MVVNDEVWKTTLRLGKPSGVKLVMKNMEDSIKAINSGVTDKYTHHIFNIQIDDNNDDTSNYVLYRFHNSFD